MYFRYGAFSFGLVRDYVPENFGQNAPPLFRKVAVRNVAKVLIYVFKLILVNITICHSNICF